jgi:threonine synthase
VKEIRYHSTTDRSLSESFQEAFLAGLAPDGGLFMMNIADLPQWSRDDIRKFSGYSYIELAETILWPFVWASIPRVKFRELIEKAYAKFAPRIERVDATTSLMWLLGPSYSFKDFAAFIFAVLLEYYLSILAKYKAIIGATSGDTGGAVSLAVDDLWRVMLYMFFPKGKIMERQRRQMSTNKNTHAIEAKGTFNVCQDIALALLNDRQFAYELTGDSEYFTSANSVSIGRFLPQAVYPFYGQAVGDGSMANAALPAGNFGDALGTFIAKLMGLPIGKMILGLNENAYFEDFLRDGRIHLRPFVDVASSAQSVINTSNVPRLFEAFGGQMYDDRDPNGQLIRKAVIAKMPDMDHMRHCFYAATLAEDGHYQVMRDVYQQHGIQLDPHGATAWYAYEQYRNEYCDNNPTIIYETAHPGKFPDKVYRALGEYPEIPEGMKAQESLEERIYTIHAEPDIVDGNMQASAEQIREAKELFRSIYKQSHHALAMA